MDAEAGSVWFVGDLEDPWVLAIAEAVPGAIRRSCPGSLPEGLFESEDPPRTLVLHRAILTPRDGERVARLRAHATPPARVVLCVGPLVRHADLERWSGLVDVVIPEATARDTIARHVWEGEPRRPDGPRPRVWAVSGNFELRQAIAEACAWAGYPAEAVRDWPAAGEGGLALWDVPVLEPGWPEELARRAAARPVAALLGFADRTTVAEARARGALACLDLPFELADLLGVLDRLAPAGLRAEQGHAVPPPPAGRPVADRGRVAYNSQ